MTRKERALMTMDGLMPDRVPVMFYRHFAGHPEETVAQAYVDWAIDCGIDMTVVQVDGYDGCPIDNVTGTIDDLKDLKALNKDHPFIATQVERARKASELALDRIAVFPVMYTPYNNIMKTFSHGFDYKLDMRECWADHRDVILDAMKYAEEMNDILLEEYKAKTGVDGVFISFRNGGEHAHSARLSDEEYTEYLKEYDDRLLAHANANFKYNISHFCGAFGGNNLSLWRDYDYQVLNWDVHVEKNPDNGKIMDLAEGRRYFKENTVLMGGFDNREGSIIYTGTKDEVKNYTKQLIKQAGEKRLIISSDCSIDYRIPVERIRWVVEACEEYGK